jgi:SOS-response transcriptional repressor LexA
MTGKGLTAGKALTAGMGLTARQKAILDFLRAFAAEHGVAPSYSEICEQLEIRSKATVGRLIAGLESRGAIRRLPRHARAIEIIATPDSLFEFLSAEMRMRLDAWCRASGDDPKSVLADALTLHLDDIERPTAEAAE